MSFQNQIRSWSRGDQLIAGGSLVLLVAMFLPWYSVSASASTVSGITFGGYSASISGFNSWGWLTFIALLVLVAFWAVRTFASNVEMPALPVKDGYILLGLAAVEVIGALLFLAASGGNSVSGPGFSAGISWGWFIALVAAVATAAGAFLKRDAVAPVRPVPATAGGYNSPPPPPPPAS